MTIIVGTFVLAIHQRCGPDTDGGAVRHACVCTDRVEVEDELPAELLLEGQLDKVKFHFISSSFFIRRSRQKAKCRHHEKEIRRLNFN